MDDQKRNWNLDDIITLEEFEETFEKTKELVKAFCDRKKDLKPEMRTELFVQIYEEELRISESLYRLYDRPALALSINTEDEESQKLKSRVLTLLIETEDKTRFFSRWTQGLEVEELDVLDDENAKRLFAACGSDRFIFERARALAKHTLSENEEKVISRKDAILKQSLLDVRNSIDAIHTFEFKPESEKETRTISNLSELLKYVHDPRSDYRKAAYEAVLTKYKDYKQIYFLIFQGIQKDWDTDAEARSYHSPIAKRNEANDLEHEHVETLLEVCEQNVEIFQEFFKKKAEILGVKKLSRFDLYAPYPTVEEEEVSYEESIESVLNTFDHFHKPFADKARQIIEEGHVDTHPAEKKSSGAFCATISPSITPYVMLNFTGRVRDISVIAHELGHGVHSLYANDKTIFSQHPVLPLAETASTLGELLLFEKLLKDSESDIASSLLFDKISDFYATIIRQSYFAKFEIKAHEAISNGVSVEELSDIYYSTLKEQFGDSVEIDSLFRYEWLYVPHMVKSPFYVYSYAFGELLALSIYSNYKQIGETFIPKIEGILKSGRTASPAGLLKENDIDITQKEFWQASFDQVTEWVEKLNV